MSDLISRKALIQRFWEFTNGGKQRYLIPEEIWEMVELMPTAYDPDKIVEQLEKFKQLECGDTNDDIELYELGRSQGKLEAYLNAIEIVKGGGTDE